MAHLAQLSVPVFSTPPPTHDAQSRQHQQQWRCPPLPTVLIVQKESTDIVMWTSTGTAFGIRDMTSFRQDVLTCYFKRECWDQRLATIGALAVFVRECVCYTVRLFLWPVVLLYFHEPCLVHVLWVTHMSNLLRHLSCAAL